VIFQNALLAVDFPCFYLYIATMDAELTALDQKIAQLVELCQRLRAQNSELRQKVAALEDENKRLRDRMAKARARLEALVERLPEEIP
jgi:cell division protein ZapB